MGGRPPAQRGHDAAAYGGTTARPAADDGAADAGFRLLSGPQPARRPAGSRGKSPAPRDRGGGVPLARTASRDAPLATLGRPTPRREPGRSRLAHNKAEQPRQPGAGSQLPRLGGLRTARDDAPPAEAAPGPDRAGAVGAGRRAPLGTNFLCRPAPRPSAGPPRRVGRPSRSRGPQQPEGGRGESQGPAGNFLATPPWPLATHPPPLPLHLLGRGLHPPGRPRPWLRGLARRGTGRQWQELLLAPRVGGSPGRRRRGRRLLHLPGALTPRFQRADPSGTFATLLAFHGRHVTPPPASLSAAYQPGRGACGPGCSAAGPLRPAAASCLPVAAVRARRHLPAASPPDSCGLSCHFVIRPQLQYCPFDCTGISVGNSVVKATVFLSISHQPWQRK